MTIYNRNSMVKKDHVKIIVGELEILGSKVQNDLDLEKEHCLANLLYLASGNGRYKLPSDQINQIKSEEFSIDWK